MDPTPTKPTSLTPAGVPGAKPSQVALMVQRKPETRIFLCDILRCQNVSPKLETNKYQGAGRIQSSGHSLGLREDDCQREGKLRG